MSLLTQRVAETLSGHGTLAQFIAGFQPREGQTDMALAVSQTVEEGGQLVVEAGTVWVRPMRTLCRCCSVANGL